MCYTCAYRELWNHIFYIERNTYHVNTLSQIKQLFNKVYVVLIKSHDVAISYEIRLSSHFEGFKMLLLSCLYCKFGPINSDLLYVKCKIA